MISKTELNEKLKEGKGKHRLNNVLTFFIGFTITVAVLFIFTVGMYYALGGF